MSKPEQKILFIYNADSGFANALIDQGKKYLTPSQYACQLCMVSYGPLGMRKDWKKFVSSLPYEVVFLHKDELSVRYPNVKTSLPAMVLLVKDRATVKLDGSDFESIDNLDQLKAAVMKALEE